MTPPADLDALYRAAVQASHDFSNGRGSLAEVERTWDAAWNADPAVSSLLRTIEHLQRGDLGLSTQD